MTNQITRRNKK